MELAAPDDDDLDRTTAALGEALGDSSGWTRCEFVHPQGHAMVVEKATNNGRQLRVSLKWCRNGHCKRTWVVQLNEHHGVSAIIDDDGNPVTAQNALTLNNVLWHFHRLAVENVAWVSRRS